MKFYNKYVIHIERCACVYVYTVCTYKYFRYLSVMY